MLRFILLCSFGIVLLSSCISYHALPKNEAWAAHNRINSQGQSGLFLAAESYADPDKSNRYFHQNLLDSGYIPVYICATNRGEDEFTIRRENIVFQFEDGMEAVMADVSKVLEDTYYSEAPAFVMLPLGIAPGIITWYLTDRANEKMAQDYHQKAFCDLYIRPGDRISGFVFFKMPVGLNVRYGQKLLQDGSVEMLVDKKARGENMAEMFNFILSIEEK